MKSEYKILKTKSAEGISYLSVALLDGTVLPNQLSLTMVNDMESKRYTKCTAVIEFFIETKELELEELTESTI